MAIVIFSSKSCYQQRFKSKNKQIVEPLEQHIILYNESQLNLSKCFKVTAEKDRELDSIQSQSSV